MCLVEEIKINIYKKTCLVELYFKIENAWKHIIFITNKESLFPALGNEKQKEI